MSRQQVRIARSFRDDISIEEAQRRLTLTSIHARQVCKKVAEMDDNTATTGLMRMILAAEYLRYNGMHFEHAGVHLSLDCDVIEIAIESNIEAAFLMEYGSEDGRKNAQSMLGYMTIYLGDDDKPTLGMTEIGLDVMDELMRALCESAKEVMDRHGKITAETMGIGGVQ